MNHKTKFKIEDACNFNIIGDVFFTNQNFAYSMYHYEKNNLISDVYYQGKVFKGASLPAIDQKKVYYLKNTISKKPPQDLPYYLVEQYFIKRQIYQNNKKITHNNLDIFDYKVQDSNLLYKAYQYTQNIPLKDYQYHPLVMDSPSFYSDKEYGLLAKRKIVFFFNDKEIKINGNIQDYLFVKDAYVVLYTNSQGFFVEQFNFQNKSLLKIKLDGYHPSFSGFSTLYHKLSNALIFTMNQNKDQYNDPKNLYLLKLEKDATPIPLIAMKYLQDGVQEEVYHLPCKALHSSTYLLFQEELYFISSKNATTALYKVSLQQNAIPTLVDDSYNYIHLYSDNNILYSLVSNQNVHSFLIQQDDKKVLLDPNPHLQKKVYAQFETINTLGRNNQKLQAFYYYPNTKKKKIPLIVLIHGGPNGFFSSGFSYEVQLYASKGYGVLLPNPRGGSGFGKSHGNMNHAFGKDALYDIEDMTSYLLKTHPNLDASRTAITGGSYGGYETLYAAIHSKMFKVAISHRPLVSFQMTGSCSSSAGSDPSNKEEPFEHYLKENINANLSTYVENVSIPIQICISKQDANCLPEASIQFFKLLDFYKPELPKRLCLYPDSNHGLFSYGPANLVKQAYQDALDWLAQYL